MEFKIKITPLVKLFLEDFQTNKYLKKDCLFLSNRLDNILQSMILPGYLEQHHKGDTPHCKYKTGIPITRGDIVSYKGNEYVVLSLFDNLKLRIKLISNIEKIETVAIKSIVFLQQRPIYPSII